MKLLGGIGFIFFMFSGLVSFLWMFNCLVVCFCFLVSVFLGLCNKVLLFEVIGFIFCIFVKNELILLFLNWFILIFV